MSNFGWSHPWIAQKKLESWARREKTFTRSDTSTSSSTDTGADQRSKSLSIETPPSTACSSNQQSIESEEVASLAAKTESIQISPSKTFLSKTLSGGSSSTDVSSLSPARKMSTSSSGHNGKSSGIWNFSSISVPGPSSPGPSSSRPREWLKNKAARLVRTPSVSSQSSVESGTSKNGCKLTSPQIKTFGPDGRNVIDGTASGGIWSPLLGRSPSPHKASPLGTPSRPSNLKGASPEASLKINRCPSPLLLTPKLDRNLMAENGGLLPLPPPSPLGAIQRELYVRMEGPIVIPLPEQQMPGFPLGRLHFSLKYDFDKSDLCVHILEAENLAGTDKGGFREPFVKVSLLPEVDNRIRKTNPISDITRAVFDEKFKFPVSYDEIDGKTLLIQVNDCDRYVRNEIIGEVKISLTNLNIHCGVDVWGEIARQPRPKKELQEILISLNYLPSAQRLTVVIVEARNLILPFLSGKIVALDPVAKVFLLVNGKRVKKKKTSTCKNTADPLWNESIAFSINDENLKKASVEVCVASNGQEIGWCYIENKNEGCENHWARIIEQPRKSIVMWHTLR